MRRLSAILAADVVGYSRLMGEDEAGTLAALRAHRTEIFDPMIAERGGRLVKLMGDGALVEFSSVVDAVEAALVIQKRVAEQGGPIRLRIGINLGDVIIDGDDIYGDGVNVAARLEALAEPGGICIASIVHESIGNRVETEFADAGEHEVKGVKRPIRVFRWPDAGTPSSAPGRTPNQPVRKTSIAVLPFDNISGDAAQDGFVDGLTEDIVTALSRSRMYDVTARNSTFSYKGSAPDVRDAAMALGVNYVLEGSVRTSGGSVRITAQLIEATSGNHVWADRYDRKIGDDFALQDEIAQRVSSILGERIWQDVAKSIGHKSEESFGPYEYVYVGIELLHKLEPDDVERAKEYIQKALELAPDLPPGHLGMGFCCMCDWQFWGDSTNTALDKAHQHALKLRDLAPDDAQTYRLLSRVFNATGELDASWKCVERALSINPNDGDIIANRGVYHLFHGEFEAAHEWLDKVLALHADTPHTVDIMHFWKSLTYFSQGDYETANASIGGLSSLNFLRNLLSCACYDRLDQPEKARTRAEAVLQARPQFKLADQGLWKAFNKEVDQRHLFGALSRAGLPE